MKLITRKKTKERRTKGRASSEIKRVVEQKGGAPRIASLGVTRYEGLYYSMEMVEIRTHYSLLSELGLGFALIDEARW